MNLADFRLTTSSYLSPGELLPLVIQPAMAGVNLASWAGSNREYINMAIFHAMILEPRCMAQPPIQQTKRSCSTMKVHIPIAGR